MKAAGIPEIKTELKMLTANELLEICLRLARAKKDNKELLSYLLFESHNPDGYISQLKAVIDESLQVVNRYNMYLLKKGLRKLLSLLNKHLKYMASKAAEAEVLLYFCSSLQQQHIPYKNTSALYNIYQSQLKKIETAVQSLHEDLQHDFKRQLQVL